MADPLPQTVAKAIEKAVPSDSKGALAIVASKHEVQAVVAVKVNDAWEIAGQTTVGYDGEFDASVKVKFSWLLLLCLLLPAPASAQTLRAALFGPGVIQCDSVPRYGYWQNLTGAPIYLRKIKVWIGATYGAVIDTGASITLDGGAEQITIVAHAQDRYQVPAEPQDVWYDFTPDYVFMEPMEWLSLRSACTIIRNWDGTIVADPRAAIEPNAQIFYTTQFPGSWSLWHLAVALKDLLPSR